jgi:hypothetical protein
MHTRRQLMKQSTRSKELGESNPTNNRKAGSKEVSTKEEDEDQHLISFLAFG